MTKEQMEAMDHALNCLREAATFLSMASEDFKVAGASPYAERARWSQQRVLLLAAGTWDDAGDPEGHAGESTASQ